VGEGFFCRVVADIGDALPVRKQTRYNEQGKDDRVKRLGWFLVLLAVLVGGGYWWWQANASRIITAQVREMTRGFFVDAKQLTVSNTPIHLLGLRQARVPSLTISGQQLQLRNGPQIADAKLTLTDLDVVAPPVHCTHVGGGTFTATVSQGAVTDYLRKRGIPLTVSFTQAGGTKLAGEKEVTIPLLNTHLRIPFVAIGKLTAAKTNGQVNFHADHVTVAQAAITVKQVTDALELLNPVIDLSGWPLISEITPVTHDGSVTLHGKITGVQPSLLP